MSPSRAAVDMAFVREAARGELTLPSVPRVVRQLIAQLRSPEVSIGVLVAELEQEPHLAARTLRIANSPYYSGRRSLASLADAVAVIGTEALRTLVISGGLQAVFVAVPNVNLRQFWRDASITAQAARALALIAGRDSEAAFLAGLLHQVGHLILCLAFADRLPQRLASAKALRGAELAALESQVCGLTHAQVSAAWLDELAFPPSVVDAVALHLQPQEAPDSLAPLVALATQVAACVEGGDSAETAVDKLDPVLLTMALGSPRPPDTFAASYRQIVAGGGLL
ncbi:signal transduction protein [Rubrivivax gelatinosus]|nr:signal transduction protein [Rubrivivax gelatinosus]